MSKIVLSNDNKDFSIKLKKNFFLLLKKVPQNKSPFIKFCCIISLLLVVEIHKLSFCMKTRAK